MMEKLKKIIKGLESRLNHDCSQCPYDDDFNCLGCDVLLRDAIALLKAQEAVEPVIETHWETPSVYDEDVKVTENKCGACGAEIDKWDKFCRVCGRAVKWDD